MAKRGYAKRAKQGIISWITSLIALLIGLGPVWKELIYGAQFGNWEGRIDNLNRFYNPLRGDSASLKVGYGSLVGGLLFKVVTSELTKRAKMRSIIPALHG